MKNTKEDPLKVCIITFLPSKEDGIAEYSKYLIEFLSREKLDLYVISQVTKDKEYRNQMSHRKNVHIFSIWRPRSILNQFCILRKIIRIQPSIIHVQYGPYSEYGGILGEPLILLLTFLRLLRFRCVVTLHSIWLLQEARARAYERIKSGFLSKIASIYYFFFMKILLELFNLVLVCVNFEGGNIVQQIIAAFGVSHLRVGEIVHGSIDAIAIDQKVEARTRLSLEGSSLLCFGFIRRDKGYEYAIRAFSHLKKKGKNIKMIIAGTPLTPDGWDYLETLKDLVNELQLGKDVIFDTRYVPEKDMINYLSSSVALLLPYDIHAGPSGPLAIAAGFGLPTIVTSDEKFAPSSASPFVRIVPPRNSLELARAIQEVLENEEIRNKMSREAVVYAAKYGYRELAKQHLTLYLSTTQGKEQSS